MSSMEYQDALDYVFSFIDFSLTHQENISPDKFEIKRMKEFAALLGNPQQQYPTIHIAGTKGKGSVATFCAAGLRAAGYKVGLYTSPHLQDFRERIQVDGQMISEENFVRMVELVKPVVPQLPGMTSYEIQTALAFLHFARQLVDIAVIEVGMGGRLDSTNIITPLISVITSISIDHASILGDTLTKIAGEKGGIIKEGVPCVSAPQKEEAITVLQSIAVEREAPFTLVGEDVKFELLCSSLEGQVFSLQLDDKSVEMQIPLLGAHQVENAATAYTALNIIRKQGWNLTDEAVMRGFSQVQWLGRFEIVRHKPYVVFDGAHNPYSAAMLRQAVRTYCPDSPILLIFGASEDKDIQGMFAELLPDTQTLLPVQAGHPRALAAEKLAQHASGYNCQVIPCGTVLDAFQRAMEMADDSSLVLVTGSLYLVGEARQVWFTHFG
jgi:dihydrofolate synthase/folylpolyglutamate synthase